MEGLVNVEWHGQDYLHLKWHVVCSELATSGLESHGLALISLIGTGAYFSHILVKSLSLFWDITKHTAVVYT